MKARKFFSTALLACVLSVSSNVSAEQPAAEEYRQMFRSGNFYVEYQIFRDLGGHNLKSANTVLAGQDGKRLYRGRYDVFDMTSNYEKLSAVYNDPFSNQRAVQMMTISNKNYPDVLYQDGKYYRLFETGKTKKFSFSNKQVLAFRVLPENLLNSPVLDPEEEWQYVREDLALPDELAVFYWNEPFRDNAFQLPAPIYDSSSKKTVEKKEYDCDRYITEIKNLTGDVVAQEIYDMLYENGKLVLIRKYLAFDGNENFVREFQIKEITSNVPEKTFVIGKKIKVYAAANGDMDDILEQSVEVETLGGK